MTSAEGLGSLVGILYGLVHLTLPASSEKEFSVPFLTPEELLCETVFPL